jgi:hypothetical protein
MGFKRFRPTVGRVSPDHQPGDVFHKMWAMLTEKMKLFRPLCRNCFIRCVAPACRPRVERDSCGTAHFLRIKKRFSATLRVLVGAVSGAPPT